MTEKEIEEEKTRLTHALSEQYAQNSITIEEYERLLGYITNIETRKEVAAAEKLIGEQSSRNDELLLSQAGEKNEKQVSLFSWRSSTVTSVRGNGGTYTSIFGANRITVDSLPKGKTILHVNSIFGLTEIIVSKDIRIVNKTVPFCSGIFAPPDMNQANAEVPELYIFGKAVFGNITILQR